MVGAALAHPGLRLTAAELIALRPPGGADRHRPASRRPGAIPARVAGQGMDLREIRAFADGDDMRRIDPDPAPLRALDEALFSGTPPGEFDRNDFLRRLTARRQAAKTFSHRDPA